MLKAWCVLISASLPKTPFPRERLCMLCWLCISAIVVVCCRCVLHRLCSTTCMRPCIEPLGIHARHPCRGYITGATAPRPRWGLRPSTPFSITIEVFQQSESVGRASPIMILSLTYVRQSKDRSYSATNLYFDFTGLLSGRSCSPHNNSCGRYLSYRPRCCRCRL